MPRNRTLSGRVERRQRRTALEIERNRSENGLIDNFKSALNAVPIAFESHSLGLMNLRCSFCLARHFNAEVTVRNNNAFALCCHKGKVALPTLSENVFFKNLCEGQNSSDRATKQRSQNYLKGIRSYNSAFAMVSSEAKLDTSVLNGIYHFKIHDVFYHRAGALIPENGRTPSYAQLYFYDVDTAVQHRMTERANISCDASLMRELAVQLERANPFVRSFRTMAEYCRHPNNNCSEVCMLIKVNHNTDLRRFNDAVETDVAAIFRSENGEPPFERNMVVFSKNNQSIRSISVLDSSLDPLAYPLLFPNGDTGWHVNMLHSSNSSSLRNKTTMLQYASFRLAIRDEFSLLHRSQKLFLQWIVDIYVRIEGSRLHFVRQNQVNLRAELYNNLTDFVHQHPNGSDIHTIGRRVILPSSFIGSPRNMYQNYLDAMTIVQNFGKPSLFITMTCNPRWPEITNNLAAGESSNFRPDIVVRVFQCKLKELINLISKKQVFGRVDAFIYTIEFQKRGLPHAHMLLTLTSEDRVEDSIDRFVSAEIPDFHTQPKLHELVKTHMIHGPCGVLNPNSVCMRDGKCSKQFPKQFCSSTTPNVNGYPVYKRRDNGVSVDVRGTSVDNRFVVPYNPYLLAKFNCHINVEVCSTVKSVKYIYKYVYKGYDCASVEIGRVAEDGSNNEIRLDEVQNFLSGRYVGSTEANWRIYEYPMHFQSHSIVRLECHLPQQQNLYFRQGNERQAVLNNRTTKLMAFFILNQIDSSANQLLYTEVPNHYVWNDQRKIWTRRLRGAGRVISRLYIVSPKKIELFHLRLLLLHVRGPKTFDDLLKFEGVLHPTFVAACYARGIASNNNEWRVCLNEIKDIKSPREIRELFAHICALNVPANSLDLWNEFKSFMTEDFLIEHNEEIAFNKALLHIEDILQTHNLSCSQLGLPSPRFSQDLPHIPPFDPVEENRNADDMYDRANTEQREIIDRVMRQVLHHDTGCNVFCLTAHAGCGKTFVQTAIIHRMNSLNLQCIACAFSGIASTLLIGGRTLHNVFKLPIPILEDSVSTVSANSAQGQFIKAASLIIIDEISMCPLFALKLIDRLLKDFSPNESRNTLFGGKTILMCGDFRQTLPVVPHGTRVTQIENSILSWPEFLNFHKLTLTRNMRALPQEIQFVEFLKSLGNGDIETFPQLGQHVIQIPTQLVGVYGNIIDDIYGNISDELVFSNTIHSVILAPTNDDCALINSEILHRMQGEEKSYFSQDQVDSDDIREQNNYPVEFLNSLTLSGLPPHKLILKEKCIVLLIRNFNTAKGLVNGTRMRVKRMYRNSLDCEVLTGVAQNTRVLLPRIHLTYSGTLLPFSFRRTQFPVIPAFAMTINKSQGQTFHKVGVLLRQPVFSHGQLYVAASRVRSFDSLRFYIADSLEQVEFLDKSTCAAPTSFLGESRWSPHPKEVYLDVVDELKDS